MSRRGFGNRLRQLRDAKNLTQEELARRAELHRVYITQLETGAQKNPSLDTLHRLAKALGVSVAELLE